MTKIPNKPLDTTLTELKKLEAKNQLNFQREASAILDELQISLLDESSAKK